MGKIYEKSISERIVKEILYKIEIRLKEKNMESQEQAYLKSNEKVLKEFLKNSKN